MCIKRLAAVLYLSLLISMLFSCQRKEQSRSYDHQRHQEESIGFAQYSWQMDSLLTRISSEDKEASTMMAKAVISPHDDYGYVGGLYTKTLTAVKANTVVLIGVAHRARNFDLQDKLIFGSYDAWQAPGGPIPVSFLRDELKMKLRQDVFVVHDSMMQLEHSLEAITPFLQKQNPAIEIVPILVPYTTFAAMDSFSSELANALQELMHSNSLAFGRDLAIVISNDAIHYGNTDWGGSDLAPFGVDSIGTQKAYAKDLRIIKETLSDTLSKEKLRQFNKETIMPDDYKAYRWTWCGRYSTPFGLLTANKLNLLLNERPLVGQMVGYRSSIHAAPIPVADLQMGHTAKADTTHWVGYVGMHYH